MTDKGVIIEDLRKPEDFKVYTFSNYKKCEVKKELLEKIHVPSKIIAKN